MTPLNENTQSHPVGADIKLLPEWVKKDALESAREFTKNHRWGTPACCSGSFQAGYEEAAQAVLERVQSLLEALEFYADEENYNVEGAPTYDQKKGAETSGGFGSEYDSGLKAREALAAWKK